MAGWIKDLITDTPFGNIIQNKLQQRESEYQNKSRIAGNIAQSVGIQSATKMMNTDPFMVARETDAELQRIKSKLLNKDTYLQQAEMQGEIEGTQIAAQNYSRMVAESDEDYLATSQKLMRLNAINKLKAEVDPEVQALIDTTSNLKTQREITEYNKKETSKLDFMENNFNKMQSMENRKAEAEGTRELKFLKDKMNVLQKIKDVEDNKQKTTEVKNLIFDSETTRINLDSTTKELSKTNDAIRMLQSTLMGVPANVPSSTDKNTTYDILIDKGQTVVNKLVSNGLKSEPVKIPTSIEAIASNDPTAAAGLKQVEKILYDKINNSPQIGSLYDYQQKLRAKQLTEQNDYEMLNRKLQAIEKSTDATIVQKNMIRGNAISEAMRNGSNFGMIVDPVIEDETAVTPWSGSVGNATYPTKVLNPSEQVKFDELQQNIIEQQSYVDKTTIVDYEGIDFFSLPSGEQSNRSGIIGVKK